ncbi:MAG: 2-amino-4-oxopentanoate thiolase subunit OrtA [Bacilli bacterium]|nr:2-amino-4-oxopentanoate thiolase subunit OrtA [Bacilli bacterium]
MIKKGSWVRIKKIILAPEERASNLPEDTKLVPLLMWTKGYLQSDAPLNSEVQIITVTGRKETGLLVEASPTYRHNYGDFVPEILKIQEIVRKELADYEKE